MLSSHGRAVSTPVFTPVARALLRVGIGPDFVSLVGTAGVVLAALLLFPHGHFVSGALLVAFFALTDTVDGLMARELESRGVRRSKDFGAFLDSTLDRVADGAIFAGLVLYYTGPGEARLTAWLALACLVLGSVVPYARARAEGLGMAASGGIAERADRVVAVLLATLLVGLGVGGWLMTVVLGLLAVASAITVVQRVLMVRAQAHRRLLDEHAGSDQADQPGETREPTLLESVPVGLLRQRRWSRVYQGEKPVEPWLARRRARRRRVRRPIVGR